MLRARTRRPSVSRNAQAFIEVIRFAATNRLCVDLLCKQETRRIEPYSLRSTKDGNIVLHAYDTRKRSHRNYRIDRIQGVRATGETFVPRYMMELCRSGPLAIQPTPKPAPPTSHPKRAANA